MVSTVKLYLHVVVDIVFPLKFSISNDINSEFFLFGDYFLFGSQHRLLVLCDANRKWALLYLWIPAIYFCYLAYSTANIIGNCHQSNDNGQCSQPLRMSWGIIAIFCHNWLVTLSKLGRLIWLRPFDTAKNRCPATCITAIVTYNRSLFWILVGTSLTCLSQLG